MSRLQKVILVLGLLIAFITVANMQYEDEVIDNKTYCSMVYEYKQTDGKFGWPDYKGTYKRSCK
jgi:hypothetical protein